MATNTTNHFLEVMGRVNEFATKKDYQSAIDHLQQAATYDANYFYNLGILYGKMGNPGLATAYLEKANKLKPYDPDFTQNLILARNELKEKLIKKDSTLQLDNTSTPIELFADKINHDELLGVIGLLTLAASLFWMRAYWKTRNIKKALLKPAGWVGTFGLVLTYALYGVYRVGTMNPPSVSINPQSIRSGPGTVYPEIGSLEVGIKIRMVGAPVTVHQDEIWQKIKYKGEQMGWVPLSSLLPL